jgi:hypothetical protein
METNPNTTDPMSKKKIANKACTHLMDIHRSILDGVNKLVQKITRRRVPRSPSKLGPGMPASESVSWSQDELACACGADAIYRSLVVLQQQVCGLE